MNTFLHTIFPLRCVLCDDTCKNAHRFCDDCFSSLPKTTSRCLQCALPLSSNDHHRCGACMANPPPFDTTIALFNYEKPIATLLWRLKFSGDLSIAKLLSECWIDYLSATQDKLPELIIPVPLHPVRLKERGFNQALEIAKPIGRHFKIPVEVRTCVRIKHTKPQSSLSASTRKNNVINAFGLSYSLTASHVVILDDVMTTGSTVTQIAHLLRKVGVQRIDVWCCARAGALFFP